MRSASVVAARGRGGGSSTTMRSPSSRSVIASRSVNERGRDAVGDRAGRVRRSAWSSRRAASGTSSSHCRTFFDALASRRRGPMIGSVPSWSTVFGMSLLNVAHLVDGRHQHQHERGDRDHAGRDEHQSRPRSAGANRCGGAAPRPAGSARTRAATRSRVSASVRGIERTNQIDTARIANAMQIGIAERGSRSSRRAGTASPSGAPRIGICSPPEGPSESAVTSLSYER